MNLTRLSALSIMLLLISLFSGCNSCTYPDATGTVAPEWVCSGLTSGTEMTAVGFADKSAAGESFMKQLAASNARLALANKLNNRNLNHPGQGSHSQITHEQLVNTRLIDTATSPNGRLYVLIGLPAAH